MLDIIQSVSITDINYSAAWQSLIDRYENQQLIVNHHLKVMCQDTPVKKGNKRFKKIDYISQPKHASIGRNWSYLWYIGIWF